MKTTPSLWLITLIAGLPILSETIYAPSMPSMAQSFQVPESWIEFTLALYMAGFALGVLFWGQLSDSLGRKKGLIIGFTVYVVACIGCYYAQSYTTLLLWRFIQAFGGSVGSVLGQAVARDSFQGSHLAKAYALLGAALALFPAIGSLLGGFITGYTHWSYLFLVLFGLGSSLILVMMFGLPETHNGLRQKQSKTKIMARMLTDHKVLTCGLIVAASNGISFSYFAEGSFFFIEALNIEPQWYGMSFLLYACASLVGGVWSKKLLQNKSSSAVLTFGLKVQSTGASAFVLMTLTSLSLGVSSVAIASMSLGCMMVIGMGICISTSIALAMALDHYSEAIGTASSLFGCCYYILIAFFTYMMGVLHNGSLLPMPVYFLTLTVMMLVVQTLYEKRARQEQIIA